MSFAKNAVIFAALGLLVSGTAAFAQAGGGDVPTDAKKQGTKENGPSSTGMSKSEAGANENKGSATGGQAGGSTKQQ